MIERELEIVNRLGLHARAAAKLVQVTGRFACQVTLAKDGHEVDGKSILGVLLLAAAQGSRVLLRCDGEDEEQAAATIQELVAGRFEEEA